MSLIEHAKRELLLLGYKLNNDNDDEIDNWIVNDLLELIEMFSKQGHSGSSAPYIIDLFKKIAGFKPLTPLTGSDDEWNDVSEKAGRILYQNKRCSHVFKDNEKAFDVNNSCVDITFPYTPFKEHVHTQEI